MLTNQLLPLRRLVKEAFITEVGPDLTSLQKAVEEEWLTFLLPLVPGNESLFRALVTTTFGHISHQLLEGILTAVEAKIHGLLDGGVLIHLGSELSEHAPKEGKKLLRKYLRKYVNIAFKAHHSAFVQWDASFVALQKTLAAEVTAAVKEHTIAREVSWWTPLLATCDKAEKLLQQIQ